MKKLIKNLFSSGVFEFVKSTTTVILLSSLVGLGFHLVNFNFWTAFILAFASQYILFSFISHIFLTSNEQKIKLKELEKIEQLSSILECGACKDLNVITFIPEQNERLEFKCKSCERKNSVLINFIVSCVPDPVSSDILIKE